ncbi:YsnF/AvaK domain-containing protein, partial [Streptomyces sp. SID14478]|uniref:YsnF/AvaK domain-containing protein n=1 Tax=Streptomyces sp. SID14478 TaxID=2706073 RepID=UPI0013D9E466
HAAAAGREPAMRSAAGTDGKADELIRSEERLRVGTEEEEVGQAHLRKVVVTENVTTSVPVSHEEVRVVREPIREGEAKRATIGEAETEVTLHAEKPVVRKEAVPVERVRLETEKVTETREVSDTVRKEQIEFDDPKSGRSDLPGDGKSGPRH